MKIKFRLLFVSMLLFALMTTGAVLAENNNDTGSVTVVHGVPGLTVDVYVNGNLTLPNFEPGTVTDPIELPVGDYEIIIVAAGGDPADPVLSGSATVTTGLNASIVAHLTEAGAPMLSIFVNDDSPILDDTSRLVVRHVAAAPAVDVALYDDDDLDADDLVGKLENLANPNEQQVEVPEDDYYATISPAGTDTPVAGPVELELDEQTSTIVYAVGSLADSTFTLLVQTIELEELESGQVTVVHGIPDLTVDVYVNGDLALPNFEPGTVTDPLELPVGDYEIIIVPAGGDPANPALSGSATVTSGLNASIVAHLTETGQPMLSVFVNDDSPILDDMSRLVVRHLAAAPAVDVALYDDDDLDEKDLVAKFENLTNPNEQQGEVPEDDYYATISPAGTNTPVADPLELELEDETSTIAYAVGSLADGTFTVLLQTIELEEVESGQVTVVHGIPDLTVDVYVNGDLALPNFEPGTVTDPLELPVGDYEIIIVPAGGDPANPALSGSATVTSGLNASIVAHLTETGQPMLSVFVNDASPILDDMSRLVVRHLAAAPAVDVALYDDDDLDEKDLVAKFENLTNPNEQQGEVPEDDYYATISPAGTNTPVADPLELELEDETSTIAYAVGSLADGTFTVLLQTIELEELESGQVTVVHGIPDLTVDVYVNGDLALPNFEPGTVTDPLELPVGDYEIIIVPAGGNPANPALSGSATVTSGLNASIVAHLTETGQPMLSVFVNDASPILDDMSRLVVRHLAAAPAVDVALYDDDDLDEKDLVAKFENLTNPNEQQGEVPEDDYYATISPAGTNTPVADPLELELEDETSTIAYAVGSLADGTFTVLLQTIELEELDDDADDHHDDSIYKKIRPKGTAR